MHERAAIKTAIATFAPGSRSRHPIFKLLFLTNMDALSSGINNLYGELQNSRSELANTQSALNTATTQLEATQAELHETQAQLKASQQPKGVHVVDKSGITTWKQRQQQQNAAVARAKKNDQPFVRQDDLLSGKVKMSDILAGNVAVIA